MVRDKSAPMAIQESTAPSQHLDCKLSGAAGDGGHLLKSFATEAAATRLDATRIMGKRSKETSSGDASTKKKKAKASATPANAVTLAPAAPPSRDGTEGAFKSMAVAAHFALLPHCLDDVRVHIRQLLQDQLMRFSSALGGVPLTATDVALAPGSKHGRVYGGDAHVHVDVRFNSTVFCPKPPQVLPARVNAVAPGFVGLLVHGYFNASVDKAELGGWAFDGAKWTNGDADLAVGTLVRFRLQRRENKDGILSFAGSLVDVVPE